MRVTLRLSMRWLATERSAASALVNSQDMSEEHDPGYEV